MLSNDRIVMSTVEFDWNFDRKIGRSRLSKGRICCWSVICVIKINSSSGHKNKTYLSVTSVYLIDSVKFWGKKN